MYNKLKNIISIALLVILLSPMSIKLIDSEFHHHDHFVCTAKNVKHFHQHHEICQIPGYVLSLFSLKKGIKLTEKTTYIHKLFVAYNASYNDNKTQFFYSLRAPPLNIINKWV